MCSSNHASELLHIQLLRNPQSQSITSKLALSRCLWKLHREFIWRIISMKVTIQSKALAKEILSYPLSIIKESTSYFQRKCKSTENILILGYVSSTEKENL